MKWLSKINSIMKIVSPKTTATPSFSINKSDTIFPDWHVSISFGKSTSENYAKAVVLAKNAPQYHEQIDNGVILHQAIYSCKPTDFIAYLMLYELVGSWKSTFVIVNGNLTDRKIIGKLNRCYGDKCRIGNNKYCYGASYMTENPFGCHRLQISACNTPWWSFYNHVGTRWILDKRAMKERIDAYARIYNICPCFNYTQIIKTLNALPDSMSNSQYTNFCNSGYGLKM